MPQARPPINRLVTFFGHHADVFDPKTGNCLKKPPRTYGRSRTVASCLPFVTDVRGGVAHATWPVWSGSTTRPVSFVPMPKKAAVRIYHKAVAWNRRGKLPGCHGGLLGSHVLLVLHTLIFDFLNHRTGRLDPSYNALQKATRLCRQTVARALARLKALGVIDWIRRCREGRDEEGRFVLRQETNAYLIRPAEEWHEYQDAVIPDAPHPSSWGSIQPLPSLLEQALVDARDGDSLATIVKCLDADPHDRLALALASLGRTLGS